SKSIPRRISTGSAPPRVNFTSRATMTISCPDISGAGLRMTYRRYAVSGVLIQAIWLLGACGDASDNAAPAKNDAPVVQSSPSPSATAVVSGPKRTVLAFGDSLYAGYGLDHGESLPDLIQQRLRARGIDGELINAGVSGDTTAGGRMRLAYTLDGLDRAPDLVLLGLGG